MQILWRTEQDPSENRGSYKKERIFKMSKRICLHKKYFLIYNNHLTITWVIENVKEL